MREEERLHGTLRLLALATLRLPDLAMIAQLMHIDATADDPVVLCAAHDVAGGALRLAHRALETHSRDLGYEIDAWIDGALLLATVELIREHDEPVLIDQMHQATLALTHAIAAISEDRMPVPEALSQSIRHLFVFYLVARVVRAAVRPRVEPAKHQRLMANNRVCERSPSARVIWSRFGAKPRLFRGSGARQAR